MNRVLFETSYMSLPGFELILTVFFISLFLYLCFRGLIKVDIRMRMRGKRSGILNILEKAVLFIIIVFIVSVVWDYFDIVVKYKTGHYVEIEGVVEDYSFVPGREGTIFTVDGVEFCCPSSGWGYFPTNESNRVIKGSGQHVKIKYIPDETNGNVIVYIEQLKEDIH